MPRAKQPGDDQAAAELDRMAWQFGADADRYNAELEALAKSGQPSLMTAEQADKSEAFTRGLVLGADRARRSCQQRATRLRNGTAGR